VWGVAGSVVGRAAPAARPGDEQLDRGRALGGVRAGLDDALGGEVADRLAEDVGEEAGPASGSGVLPGSFPQPGLKLGVWDGELLVDDACYGLASQTYPGSAVQPADATDALAVFYDRPPFHFLPLARLYIEMSVVRRWGQDQNGLAEGAYEQFGD
jgi:hypothetical protein